MISFKRPIGRDTDDGKDAGTGSALSMKLEGLPTIEDRLASAATRPTTDGSNDDLGCAKLARIPYP
jgi:hypothetical protein